MIKYNGCVGGWTNNQDGSMSLSVLTGKCFLKGSCGNIGGYYLQSTQMRKTAGLWLIMNDHEWSWLILLILLIMCIIWWLGSSESMLIIFSSKTHHFIWFITICSFKTFITPQLINTHRLPLFPSSPHSSSFYYHPTTISLYLHFGNKIWPFTWSCISPPPYPPLSINSRSRR